MFRKLHDLRPDRVTIFINGVPVEAEPGETVAAVLLRQRQPWARQNPATNAQRAPYCMMGVCFECVAEIDGVASQTCLAVVRDGTRVNRQLGKRSVVSSAG